MPATDSGDGQTDHTGDPAQDERRWLGGNQNRRPELAHGARIATASVAAYATNPNAQTIEEKDARDE